MQIDPRRLGVLLTVHRAGGIAAAAAAEHVSASAVSQQIARLEAETGVQVLDRRPTGAGLTTAGRVLAEAAERIEAELAETRRTLAAIQDGVSGSVVVGGFKTVVTGLLIGLVRRLQADSPGLEVVVQEAEGEAAQRRLRHGDLDVLVLEADSPLGRAIPRGMRDHPVLDEQWRLVIPSSATEPGSLDDLEHLTWLTPNPGAAAYAATRRLVDRLREPRLTPHHYDDYGVALAMVGSGLGCALVPELALLGQAPEAVRVLALPGLGTRRVVARTLTSQRERRPEVRLVLRELGLLSGHDDPLGRSGVSRGDGVSRR
ncbi:LysR family transcriptional regulator [Nocardioides lijunqiniae]|uniref:LysR family transcriptional regulator n=1 Tax=Nocardioides lijunqiniae TaxID=2760832 RepID=UPI001878490A|nr:LysR family transcriptional regulator [Nocardioides lijunqiniae]